jgi:hypothetical protein
MTRVDAMVDATERVKWAVWRDVVVWMYASEWGAGVAYIPL